MESVVEKLKSEVCELDCGRRGEPYPAELKARLVAAAKELMAGGASCWQAGKALGVHGATVRRWCEPTEPRKAKFMPVRIVDDAASRVAVVAPSGWRVEGLSLDAAAQLLRSLA